MVIALILRIGGSSSSPASDAAIRPKKQARAAFARGRQPSFDPVGMPADRAVDHRVARGGRDARMRSEKSGAPSAACAASLIRERRRSSSNDSDVSTRPEW